MKTAVLILAGGSGVRLRPLSSEDMPKQFLRIFSNNLSFFQATVNRALKIAPSSDIFVLTQKAYSGHIKEQAPQIPAENIFYENHKRNTAPAICTAIMKINKLFSDAVSVVLPADHYIADEQAFISTVNNAIKISENNDNIISIGIVPTRPDTSFGYIKYKKELNNGILTDTQFKEKPDYSKAVEMISEGKCLWNSGIFVTKNSFMISQYQKHLPDVFDLSKEFIFAENDQQADEIYSKMPALSVDYGVLEKTDSVLLLKGDFGWDDIGTWNAVERLSSKNDLLF